MREPLEGMRLVRFEAFEVNLTTGEVRKHGIRLKVQDQPFQVLVMLLARPGKLVTRDEIRQRLWPSGTFVDFDNGLNTALSRLREALGDSAESPRYIETLARRGYRWMVPVDWMASRSADLSAAVSVEAPSEAEATSDNLIGKKISHYRVLGVLGGGGMGLVYRAEDIKLGRGVALKFLPEEVAHDHVALERFEREARAASALNHPHICTIYEFGEYEGQPFIVMELLEGQTLRERLGNASEQLQMNELIDLAIQITDGLDAAHQKGIIHRDIKTANIFLTNRGEAKILDFGLARIVNLDEHPHNPLGEKVDETCPPRESISIPSLNSTLTLTGAMIGTVSYMSPEQVRGEKLDSRTDLFSFGLVLYEMATGQRAFRGNTVTQVNEAILNREPPSATVNPAVPPKLEEVINKALEKDKKLRYQSAAEIRADLQRLKRDSDTTRSAAATAQVESKSARKSIRWAAVAGATIVVIGLAVGGWLFFSRKAHALTDKDTIVLAEFTNTTGDPVFDGTLRQGLSAQLEQSPFLSLLSDQRVAQTLALMAQPKDARLTRELAHEVCQRTASAATIEGSISSLGSQYVVGLRAVNCHSGDVLANEQTTASGKEQVLKALGEAATKMREKLGESLASVQKYDAPAENVTTPSLEALQAYSLGYQAMKRNDHAAAVPLFQRATSLDPNFAMAYARLGTSYQQLGEGARGAEYIRKAYELRERVSEREKLYIVSHYEHLVTGNLEAARKTYELWAQTYPRDDTPPANLVDIYSHLGDYDKALAQGQEAMKLDPGSGNAYADLVSAYVVVNRLDEARATAQEAQAHNLDNPAIHLSLYIIDFLQHDTAGMEREAAGLMGKPGFDDFMLDVESDTAAYGGQFAKARELTRRAVESAQRADEKETGAGYEAEAAVREALVGNMSQAKQQTQVALALSTGTDVEAMSAIALGLTGDAPQATRLAADLAKRFPEDTIVQFEYLPMIHAAAALQSGSANKALEALVPAALYELGTTGFNLYPVYLRGEAYLAAHQGSAAAAEFQKILDHACAVWNNPIGALAHLGLARAYAMQGDTTKAKAAYQDFLTLWKDADPDIPILIAAKAEYAKL
jgi:serine/threonine protein kinase/Tfp pilus assembly protein PilF